MTEVLQTEEGQKQKLKIIIDALNSKLFPNGQGTQKWTAELIHSKVCFKKTKNICINNLLKLIIVGYCCNFALINKSCYTLSRAYPFS